LKGKNRLERYTAEEGGPRGEPSVRLLRKFGTGKSEMKRGGVGNAAGDGTKKVTARDKTSSRKEKAPQKENEQRGQVQPRQ